MNQTLIKFFHREEHLCFYEFFETVKLFFLDACILDAFDLLINPFPEKIVFIQVFRTDFPFFEIIEERVRQHIF